LGRAWHLRALFHSTFDVVQYGHIESCVDVSAPFRFPAEPLEGFLVDFSANLAMESEERRLLGAIVAEATGCFGG